MPREDQLAAAQAESRVFGSTSCLDDRSFNVNMGKLVRCMNPWEC